MIFFAFAEALWRDVALPPGEHGLAAQLRNLQVGRRRDARGELIEPHEVARFVEDHRPGRPRAGVGGGEDVAGRALRGARRHFDRWRFDARRAEVLLLVVVLARRWGRLGVGQDVLVGDDEAIVEALRARAGLQPPAHGDRLAGGEGLCGDEARAVALRVATQATAVRAATGAPHRDAAERVHRRSQHADLGARGGVVGVRQRRHAEARAGQHRGAVERAREAARDGRRAEGRLLGGDPPRGDRERGGAAERDRHAAGDEPFA